MLSKQRGQLISETEQKDPKQTHILTLNRFFFIKAPRDTKRKNGTFKNCFWELKKVRELTVLVEDPGSALSTYMPVHNIYNLSFGTSKCLFWLLLQTYDEVEHHGSKNARKSQITYLKVAKRKTETIMTSFNTNYLPKSLCVNIININLLVNFP